MTRSSPIAFITDPFYLRHDTGGDHPECAARLTAVDERLKTGTISSLLRKTAPRPADRHWITAIHDEYYLLRLEETALSGRAYIDHPDNQICFDTYQTAILSAGAGLVGIDLLETSKTDAAFCCIRPPGHHAERAMALGFCFFNNCAIAARYWQRQHHRQKIVIVDWDAHHGNGIQAAFEEDPEILYISIHEHPTWSFPGTGWSEETGTGLGKGATLNIPLPPGSGDETVLKAIREQIEPAIELFKPQALLVAAGFDAHEQDDMSGLAYSTDLYRRLGEYAARWERRYCRGRLLTILEGGYHLESLAAGVESYLVGLANDTEE